MRRDAVESFVLCVSTEGRAVARRGELKDPLAAQLSISRIEIIAEVNKNISISYDVG